MTTSKSAQEEDVLLIVQNVRFKKMDGDLYVMNRRLGFMSSVSKTFKLSIAYSDIKSQRISPPERDTVKLQLILHDSTQETLQFYSAKGKNQQLADRDSVKELLQQLLPKFKSHVQVELEEKNRRLQNDPELFQLYKDLVVSGIVSATEFWSDRDAKSKVGASTTSFAVVETQQQLQQQQIGVSAHFLSDIVPLADGNNGMKYNLTGDIISAIFRTYPTVKTRHAELVPHHISEQEFWIKFFQSHYFHMDRLFIPSTMEKSSSSSSVAVVDADPFLECARLDDAQIRAAVRAPLPNPLLDLTTHRDYQVLEGFAQADDSTNTADARAFRQSSSALLIRRFNHHSVMVLNASASNDESVPEEIGATSTTATTKKLNKRAKRRAAHIAVVQPEALEEAAKVKHAKLTSCLSYADLQMSTDSSGQVSGQPLQICEVDRFLQGPTPINLKNSHSVSSSGVEHGVTMVLKNLRSARWTARLDLCCSEAAALEALRDVSASGRLMQIKGGSDAGVAAASKASLVENEMRQLQIAAEELLRHFWLCFPVNSIELETKLTRVRDSLLRFRETKLEALRGASGKDVDSATAHMEDQLRVALVRYEAWQARRQRR